LFFARSLRNKDLDWKPLSFRIKDLAKDFVEILKNKGLGVKSL